MVVGWDGPWCSGLLLWVGMVPGNGMAGVHGAGDPFDRL